MGKDSKEPMIDWGLLALAVILVILGLSPAYMSTFLSYAPCLNGIPVAEMILSCSGSDYLIGGLSVAQGWGYFLGLGVILGAAAFIPPARMIVRAIFVLALILWILGIFGVRIF